MDKHEELSKLLEDFIDAVHRVNWQSPMGIMNFFPNGCCTVASFAFGNLLQDRGLGDWHIVNGSAGEMSNHDWLVSADGWVVDATCHQFKFGIDAFVSFGGPSPLETYFPPKQRIELSGGTAAHRAVYRIIEHEMLLKAEEE
ncbi:hypothetical protein ABC337_13835 [Arthrobacter sp. 1P04PC]|uniref:hypothetical protein n=1 Tax=unclassified Arthrobacter TaxID=235627 RepID=UPI00399F649E